MLQACGTRTAVSTSAEHVRGTAQSVDAGSVTVSTATGSERVGLEPGTRFATLVASDREHITNGSFLGITSIAQPDGSRRAVEVHIFPEAMRGTGEGSYAWDLPGAGSSKMTNGTAVSSKMTNGTVTAGAGKSLTLQYHGSDQTIAIPDGIPIVALEPGQSTDLVAGAHVFVVAHRNADGKLVADRVMIGKNGLTPPM